MRIAVLGTGTVGEALGTGFARLGHDVQMGSRTTDNPKALAWVAKAGGAAAAGTFADVAAWGEVVVNATSGVVSLQVLSQISDALAGKVVVDVANPLDFSGGFPPTLAVVNDDSLAEQIQRALPEVRVVKALNTLTADLMLHPELLSSPTDVFLAGDDPDAKAVVRGLLLEAGWLDQNILDLGGVEAARGCEMWLPLWMRVMGSVGTGTFNVHVVR